MVCQACAAQATLRSTGAPQRPLTMCIRQDCGRIQCMQSHAVNATTSSVTVACWELHDPPVILSVPRILTATAYSQGDDAAA